MPLDSWFASLGLSALLERWGWKCLPHKTLAMVSPLNILSYHSAGLALTGAGRGFPILWLLVLIFFHLSLALGASDHGPPSENSPFLILYHPSLSWCPPPASQPLCPILSPEAPLAQAPLSCCSNPYGGGWGRGGGPQVGRSPAPTLPPPPTYSSVGRGPPVQRAQGQAGSLNKGLRLSVGVVEGCVLGL